MPVTTRSQARGCGELYGNIDDRIPTYATMYPVFCTTNIPPKVWLNAERCLYYFTNPILGARLVH